MIQIKILNQPRQRFSVILNRRRVTFELWYNTTSDRWSLNLSIDGASVLYGRRIVSGVDLLMPFDFGIGIIFAMPEMPGALPGRQDLPLGNVRLYHATEEEANAAVAS